MITIKIKTIFNLILLILFFNLNNCDVYTALSELEECLQTEAALINNLQNYIELHESKLQYLKQKLEEYKSNHNTAEPNVQTYLSNPIDAYRLINRLTSDWKTTENFMQLDIGEGILNNITNIHQTMKYPNDEDLNGAAVGLTRLQDTYKLDTKDIARGEINGIQYDTELSLSDCFELGRQTYRNGDFYHAGLWMTEALRKTAFETHHQIKNALQIKILEYLSFSTYKEGKLLNALQLNEQLLELDPFHEQGLRNQPCFEKEISELKNSENVTLVKTGTVEKEPIVLPPVKYSHSQEYLRYEQLCRGEVKKNSTQISALKCRYVANKSPFTIIAPFKMEEVSLDPFIGIYHDVIYDSEIDFIKKTVKPRFKRAAVSDSKTGKPYTPSYRISKVAWIQPNEHPYIKNIVRRLEDLTDLNMLTSEAFQVQNYGIGGHYEPHCDFARKGEKYTLDQWKTGNRIATVLFYMSNVDQGGATVFPQIDVAIPPVKGTAAFWYNLYTDGEGDYRTRHAACPVLTGSKWVINKWLHEHGQEFRRPCKLQSDHTPTEYHFI